MTKLKIEGRIRKYIADEPSKWIDQVEYYERNKAWLDKSAEIAVKILSTLRKQSISQKDLAEKIGVTPQYISKVVKGQENLSLETICKIEKALEVILVNVPALDENKILSWINEPFMLNFINSTNSILIGSDKTSYKTESVFHIIEETYTA